MNLQGKVAIGADRCSGIPTQSLYVNTGTYMFKGLILDEKIEYKNKTPVTSFKHSTNRTNLKF